MSIFYIILIIFVVYNLQCIIQNKFFFRLKRIYFEYKNKIITKKYSVVYNEIIKVLLMDFIFYIIILIGLFSYNSFLFSIILFSIIINQNFVLSIIKSIKIKKKYYFIDKIIIISCLILSLYNYFYYQIDSLKLLKMLLNY